MAKSLRDELLPVVQRFRNLSVEFGMRRYQVWVRTVEWSGTRVGQGGSITTDRYLGRPKFREISSKDVVAGSVMGEQMFEIGPFTPKHSQPSSTPDTLAVTPEDLSPLQTGVPTEVYYVVKGPGMPAEGALYTAVSDSSEKNFRYMLTVKKSGVEA